MTPMSFTSKPHLWPVDPGWPVRAFDRPPDALDEEANQAVRRVMVERFGGWGVAWRGSLTGNAEVTTHRRSPAGLQRWLVPAGVWVVGRGKGGLIVRRRRRAARGSVTPNPSEPLVQTGSIRRRRYLPESCYRHEGQAGWTPTGRAWPAPAGAVPGAVAPGVPSPSRSAGCRTLHARRGSS